MGTPTPLKVVVGVFFENLARIGFLG